MNKFLVAILAAGAAAAVGYVAAQALKDKGSDSDYDDDDYDDFDTDESIDFEISEDAADELKDKAEDVVEDIKDAAEDIAEDIKD
ncbi:YtxH domain-containing protein [Ruminococcus flavefaciens]|uniref:YtxH domain-containing protein n=1 Tax=Ruminococcus flavefaciens TaxID=1265 RepID=UPI0026F28A8C|nr:YtxH domain-containing protein [Ruminococcus flavefaciens]